MSYLLPSIYSNALPIISNLFPAIRWEVEHQHCEEADAHAGDDEVDGVEEGLPPHGDVEGDVQVGLVTAGVELDISLGRNLQNVPLHGHVELGEVDPDIDDRWRPHLLALAVHLHQVSVLVLVPQVNLNEKS